MNVYAFEWQSCIFESAMAVESMHKTKRGALKAMIKTANERWLEDRARQGRGWDPLIHQRWQVRTIELQE